MEIITGVVEPNWFSRAYEAQVRRQYAGIMPQAVAVWCSQLGHDVTYDAYYGQADPKSLMPDDLDVIFMSTYTQASPLAYALAKLFRKEGVLTVMGGPHASSFPRDCLRFFDLVVGRCDKTLVKDILSGEFPKGSRVDSGRVLRDLPRMRERWPFLKKAVYPNGRPSRVTTLALLSSVGCPYQCDFCVDWKTPYLMLSQDALREDLEFASKEAPGVKLSFHDPNFAVKFDRVLDVIEEIPKEKRNPYIMQASLSVLKGPRLQRLKDTGCVFMAPGIESWLDYSNKAGVGAEVGGKKLEKVTRHFREISQYIPGLQANFLFGTDLDFGDKPVQWTESFIRQLPTVWPTINIPVPFGETPMFDNYLAENRILESLPFSFYYFPYVPTTIKYYNPLEFYEKLISIFSTITSPGMFMRRITASQNHTWRLLSIMRTFAMRQGLVKLKQMHAMLKSEEHFNTFHEGNTQELPNFYAQEFRKKLGRYASLISEEEMRPDLQPFEEMPAA